MYQYKLILEDMSKCGGSCGCNERGDDYFDTIRDEYMVKDDGRGVAQYSTAQLIEQECNALKSLLLEKNRKYGDSALDPGVFNISPVTAIKARIQDKLNRLKNDNKDENEDVVLDLLGYFILLRIATKQGK